MPEATVSARTQEALYADIDTALSWSESDLPQSERTKHVHGLHPYLGKFVPQLVEVFLRRHFQPGDTIYDPFMGSGTTLVEANAFGANAIGCDISAFNCLLSEVKTGVYPLGDLEDRMRRVLDEADHADGDLVATPWLSQWYAPQALRELLAYRASMRYVATYPYSWAERYRDIAKIVLARAARSARLTTHFDLDFPREPTAGPYWCFKHKRECRPVEEARKFLVRYTADTIKRLREFETIRSPDRWAAVCWDDARTVRLNTLRVSGVITSPPYPGLIDYHEQHRYAYELLGIDDRREEEIGAAVAGRSRASLLTYVDAMSAAFANTVEQLVADAPILIVVNDSHDLYPTILANAGLVLEERLTRHVNRRTGRRSGEFYEDVLLCRAMHERSAPS